MKNIYIILTRSDTFISRLIGALTHEPFTHASIAFDDTFDKMYSFSRFYANIPLPAGLTEENIRRGFYKNRGSMPCALLSLSVDDKTYFAAQNYVLDMMCRRGALRYSILGLILCNFRIRYEFRNHFFCSQFVSKILAECCNVKLPKHSSLMHPSDLLKVPEITPVYTGELGDVRELTPPVFRGRRIPA